MSDNLRFRNDGILISEECRFYLKLKARQMVQDTDASITLDQLGDSIIREQITTENPDYVLLWDEMAEAKQRAIKEYRLIEGKALPVRNGSAARADAVLQATK